MRKLLQFTLILLLVASPAFGQQAHRRTSSSSHSHSPSAGRPYYGGGEHSESHGGSYPGATNPQSHKGGHYKNPNSNNRYGIHK
jgi:hypothetical protein